MNRIKNKLNKNSVVIKKIYSIFLLIVTCCCLVLAMYWYVKPRSVEGGESHPFSEDLMDTDRVLIYDGCELLVNLKSNVDELINIGLYSSRQSVANDKSKVVMRLQDSNSNDIYSIEYNYNDIQELSILALFPSGVDNLTDKNIKLIVSTINIDESNPLIIYKTDVENNADYFINGIEQSGYLAYLLTGANPSYFYIWYPIMLLSIVLVFCSINDWSVLYGNKKK